MTRVLSVPALLEFFQFFGQLWSLFWESLVFVFRGAISYRHTLRQMAEVGVGSLMVALLTVGFSGAVAALYIAIQLARYGQQGYVGGLVGVSLALEIAPVITAVVVAARSGSAMAAELGSMAVTEQIDALRALATSPIKYLVVPRVLGTLIMLPIITILANGAGAIGGLLAATTNRIPSQIYWSSYQNFVTPTDQWHGLLKTIPFALIIALVSCRQGLATTGGARGVGRATTSAVVFSMVGVYIVDYFLSMILQDSAKLMQ
jgi:phospholipid/cholesterol/gamma-HCH transport system permease protein